MKLIDIRSAAFSARTLHTIHRKYAIRLRIVLRASKPMAKAIIWPQS